MALTPESEALNADYRESNDCGSACPEHDLSERLAAIEAAAVARHVRETGCEGLDVARVEQALTRLWEEGYIYGGTTRDEWSKGFEEAAAAFVALLATRAPETD